MEIAIFCKSLSPEYIPFVQGLITKLEDSGSGILIYEPFLKELKSDIRFRSPFSVFYHHTEIQGKVDVMLSIGGDGTLMDTLQLVRHSGIPVLGVNMGRLGFLTSTSKSELLTAIEQVLEGKYSLDTRTLLSLESPPGLFGEVSYALNELTVYKKVPLSMILVHTYVNDEYMNSYWTDGLIVSTPTGSTAYSLSCGGPILTPSCNNFVITPIASHNLTVRPIVVPDDSTIRIQVESRQPQFHVSLDSRSVLVDCGTELLIRKAGFGLNLLKPEVGKDFFKAIRDKLNWGLDLRN